MTAALDPFSLVSELSAEERGALEGFLEPRELDAGSTLFRSGEEADALYFVLDGALAIKSEGQALHELGGGEVLGALCLVSVGRRECDVVGATPTRLLALSREGYLRLRGDLPALALRLQEAILRSFSSLVRAAVDESRSAPDPVS
ncbi:MAG TPA: cyclic nucleotide-binding domain-containing protein [Myxococcota bacterium]|nr:cyclic nucleotide-binding domain-containing protein [Myxococcota bacterium]